MSQSAITCPMCGANNAEPRCHRCGELLELKPECVLCRTKVLDYCVLPVLRADCPDCGGSGWVEDSRDGLTTQTRCLCRSTLLVCDPCENELSRLLSNDGPRTVATRWARVGLVAILLVLFLLLMPGFYQEFKDLSLVVCPVLFVVLCVLILRRAKPRGEPKNELLDWQQGSRAFRELARILREQRLLLYGDHSEEQAQADRLNQAARQVAQPERAEDRGTR